MQLDEQLEARLQSRLLSALTSDGYLVMVVEYRDGDLRVEDVCARLPEDLLPYILEHLRERMESAK